MNNEELTELLDRFYNIEGLPFRVRNGEFYYWVWRCHSLGIRMSMREYSDWFDGVMKGAINNESL